MVTLKQESILLKKLKGLTELELHSLFEEFAEHVHKNNLEEAVRQALDLNDLRSEIASLEDDIEDEQEENRGYRSKCRRASGILEAIENLDDDIQKEIDRAISELDV